MNVQVRLGTYRYVCAATYRLGVRLGRRVFVVSSEFAFGPMCYSMACAARTTRSASGSEAGGINGHVWLESRAAAWLAEPHIQFQLNAPQYDAAEINATVTVGTAKAAAKPQLT